MAIIREFVRELCARQYYAATVSELVSEAEALEKSSATGEDASGAVSVTLDPDGIPEQIWIESDRLADLAPETVGAAVVEAARPAADRRMRA